MLRDCGATNSNRYGNDKSMTENKKKRHPTGVKWCFNCGKREHVSVNCPTKALGAKCFECGQYISQMFKKKIIAEENLLRRF